jgi:hypothetical protein
MTQLLAPRLTFPRWRIALVVSLTEAETETQVRLERGDVAVFANNHPDRRSLLELLLFSLREGCPIGVLSGEGRVIMQVGTIHRGQVLGVSQNIHHDQVLNVDLGGEAAPKYLSKNHPQIAEMLRDVTRSAETEQALWYVIQGSSIVDTMILPSDEDEALCSWFRQHTLGEKR